MLICGRVWEYVAVFGEMGGGEWLLDFLKKAGDNRAF